MGSRLRTLFEACLLGLAIVLVIRIQAPPRPLPVNAPAADFSAGRALTQVRDLARAPHPMGTAEHDRVRDLLVTRFKDMGFATRIQARVAQRAGARSGVVLGSVENILAEKKGWAPTGTLLLVAHYDSHGSGPGASDDASGVAALLEVARALRPGRNTLRILITDGEEMGLLGAQAYVDEATGPSPTLVINLEARGAGGPVFMFETSDDNRGLIHAFAHSAPSPHASSLMYALYKTLPNDTDLTVFKRAGMAGLNFAFADRWQAYHSALDTADHLDPSSLQQQGTTALALARRFLEADLADLTRPGQGDSVYFDLLGRVLLHYPMRLVWPLTLVALVALGGLLLRTRAERERGKALLAGFGLAMATLVLGALVGQAVGHLVNPFRRAVPNLDPSGARWFESALLLAVLALLIPTWGRAFRRFGGRALPLGALLSWGLALLAASIWLPGGTYLFLWPLLGGLAALTLDRPWVAAVPLILLVAPLWHNLVLMLGFSLPSVLGLFLAFGLIPLVPLLRRFSRSDPFVLPSLLLAGGVACFAVGALTPSPHEDALVHLEDLDTGHAEWVSLRPPDAWTKVWLGEHPTRTRLAGRSALAAPAPALHPPSPTFVHEGPALRITLPERALALVVEPEAPAAFRLAGRDLPPIPRLHWFAPPATLTLEAPPGTRATLSVILEGLPPSIGPRPPGLLPASVDPYTDTRILRRTLVW